MGFFFIVHVVVCILLIAVILFQDGKAGGLTSVSDTSQSVFGARGAASFLTKLTSILAIFFMVTSIGLHFKGTSSQKSIASDYAPPASVTEETKVQPNGTEAPAEPAPAPATDAASDAAPATGDAPAGTETTPVENK